jgi:multicomponent Na+:H+ antiporter subunit E
MQIEKTNFFFKIQHRKVPDKMSKKNGAIFLFICLLFFWFILAQTIDLTQVIAGFLASLMIVFYNYDLIFNKMEATKLTFKAIKQLFVLFFVLIYNIIKSNIQVAIIVLTPSLPIDPHFKRIKQPLKKPVNQTLFGNSITLTPGTLTVEMDQEYIVVHGLTMQYIDDIETSALQEAFVKLEGVEK